MEIRKSCNLLGNMMTPIGVQEQQQIQRKRPPIECGRLSTIGQVQNGSCLVTTEEVLWDVDDSSLGGFLINLDYKYGVIGFISRFEIDWKLGVATGDCILYNIGVCFNHLIFSICEMIHYN